MSARRMRTASIWSSTAFGLVLTREANNNKMATLQADDGGAHPGNPLHGLPCGQWRGRWRPKPGRLVLLQLVHPEHLEERLVCHPALIHRHVGIERKEDVEDGHAFNVQRSDSVSRLSVQQPIAHHAHARRMRIVLGHGRVLGRTERVNHIVCLRRRSYNGEGVRLLSPSSISTFIRGRIALLGERAQKVELRLSGLQRRFPQIL